MSLILGCSTIPKEKITPIPCKYKKVSLHLAMKDSSGLILTLKNISKEKIHYNFSPKYFTGTVWVMHDGYEPVILNPKWYLQMLIEARWICTESFDLAPNAQIKYLIPFEDLKGIYYPSTILNWKGALVYCELADIDGVYSSTIKIDKNIKTKITYEKTGQQD